MYEKTTKINRDYWNAQAASKKVNWHIAHTGPDETEFYATGKKDINALFFNDVSIIPQNALVLDMGCGKARVLSALHAARPDLKCVGIDISPIMIRHCYDRFTTEQNMFFCCGSGNDFSIFPENTFDVVYSCYVLQHLPRFVTYGYIKDIHRILKPGSLCAIQMMYMNDEQKTDPTDDDFRSIRYYTPLQLEELFLPYFSIEKNKFVKNSVNSWFLLKKPFKNL